MLDGEVDAPGCDGECVEVIVVFGAQSGGNVVLGWLHFDRKKVVDG